MKTIIPALLSGFLLIGVVACTNAKTTSTAPNSTENTGQPPKAEDAKTTQNDATSETRKKQIEADIKAREERNRVAGNQEERADGDLESEVRGTLEANIPAGKLTVDAKDGAVTVSGTVPKQDQIGKIEPLAKKIKGVKSVAVKATVAPAQAK